MGDKKLNLIVDLAERTILLILYARFVLIFWHAFQYNPIQILPMIQGTIIIAFVVFRPFGGSILISPYAMSIALIGTMLTLFVSPVGYRPEYASIGGAMMVFAICMGVVAKLYMNRRWGFLVANRGVQTKGPYAFVRHPVYIAYIIGDIGFLIANPSLWNASILILQAFFLLLRIFEEEKFLSLDPDYRTYKERVRYRLLPKVY